MRTRVNLKMSGVRKVLTSPGAVNEVARVADEIADDVGDGFMYSVERKNGQYTRAGVFTSNRYGRRRQAKHHLLEQAIGKRR